jgi:cytochrome P450
MLVRAHLSTQGAMAETLAIDEAIVSADTYAQPGRYDALFETLRRDDPIHWTAPAGHRPFWTVSKYQDIRAVEGNPALFVNAPRLILRPIEVEERIRALTGGRSLLLRNLVNLDGEEHQVLRLLTQAWFMPPRLRALEDDLRDLARQHMDILAGQGGSCDFVHDVASWYPLRVIMRILGLPSRDEGKMLKLTQDVFGPDDPDVKTDPSVNVVSTVEEYRSYFGALTAARRAEPTDDLASLIANATFEGKPIGDLEALSYYIIVATAGHDTTSSTIAGGLLALIENPDQMRLLRDEPALLPGAIDEMLRWVTP